MNVEQMTGLMDLLGVNREEEQSHATLPPSALVEKGKKSLAPANMKVSRLRLLVFFKCVSVKCMFLSSSAGTDRKLF